MQEQQAKKRGRAAAKKAEVKEVEYSPAVIEQPEAENPVTGATFTLEQVQKMIEEALAKREAANTKEQPNTVASEEVVVMHFQDEVNDNNIIQLGPNGKFGQITGKSATITIPKREFIGEFRTSLVQTLLKNRKLIVVSGLTDAERKIYGVDYQKGEYLEPDVYAGLIEAGDAILDFYPQLNPTWQEMVAVKFIDAFENKTLKCSRDTLLKLNKISKKNYMDLPKEDVRRKGAFYSIIRRMNAADEDGEE